MSRHTVVSDRKSRNVMLWVSGGFLLGVFLTLVMALATLVMLFFIRDKLTEAVFTQMQVGLGGGIALLLVGGVWQVMEMLADRELRKEKEKEKEVSVASGRIEKRAN